MRSENQKLIIDALGEEIHKQASSCAAEQYSPSHDADASDDFIKQREENIQILRRIREQLENLFTGKV